MKLSLQVILLFFPLFFFSQFPDTLKATYSGTFEVRTGNNFLQMKGNFVNGLRHGPWEFHIGEDVYCNYKNGVLDGEYRKLERGQLRCRWNYKNGKRFGYQEDFSDGKPSRTYFMKDDKYEGEMKQYSGEVLRTLCTYKAGKRNGKTIEYHSNGKKEYEWEFKDGIANGIYIEYDSDEKPETQGQMKEGKREGKWIFISGSETKEANYKDGVIQASNAQKKK